VAFVILRRRNKLLVELWRDAFRRNPWIARDGRGGHGDDRDYGHVGDDRDYGWIGPCHRNSVQRILYECEWSIGGRRDGHAE
jgi:hypothetical protein